MSLFETTGAPERLQFFDGQRLFASDLQGLEAFHREMRRLHLSTLHEAGIASGFEVRGEEGDREVRIGPGYAIDDLGREIVLVEERVEQVPPVAGGPDGAPVTFDLTVSYRGDAFLEEAEERRGPCGARGVVRLREEPVFCWIRLGDDGQPVDERHKRQVSTGRRLTVARAEVRECRLRSRLSLATRFAALPPTQPFIASGRATPDWVVVLPEEEEVPLEALCRDTEAEFEALFVTAALPPDAEIAVAPARHPCLRPLPFEVRGRVEVPCGFRITPCFWARIEGPRLVTRDIEGRVVPVGYIDGLIRIADASPTGFEIRLRPLLAAFSEALRFLDAVCLMAEWAVVWKGVEG